MPLLKRLLAAISITFLFFSCNENTGHDIKVDELNEVEDVSADADIVGEVIKKTGELCRCDIECRDKGDLNGACIYGICGLEIDSCDSRCPDGYICKKMPLFKNDLCFRKWEVYENIPNCEGVSDYDLSCINIETESLDTACSVYSEKINCTLRDSLDSDYEEPATILSDEEKTLFICGEDEDWFKISVEKGEYLEACIEYFQPAGDLNLKLYDDQKQIIASRNPDSIDPENDFNAFNTGLECLAVFSENTIKTYYLSVTGHGNEHNSYNIAFRFLNYSDGANCIESGFSREECDEILQFPLSDKESENLSNNYRFDLPVNYRFATRELVMATRYAIGKTTEAFPGTNPLWINIISQKNGLTPGADVGYTLTYNYSNHTHGKAIDTAFFQKNNDNKFRNICGEDATFESLFCDEEDRYSHLVDIEKQVFYIKSLYNTKVFSGLFLVDWLIAEEIIKQAETNNDLDPSDIQYINDEELEFIRYYVYGEGFPAHNTHLHVGI